MKIANLNNLIIKIIKTNTIIALAFCLLIFSSCSGSDIKESLGLKKYAPDEFMVVSRPALTMPPSYMLVEPEAQKVSDSKTDEAKSLLFSNKHNYKAYISDSEKSLLKNAKTSSNKKNIRKILDEEYSEYLIEKKENKESLLSSLNPFNNDNEQTLDAKKEKERIQKNQEDGKSILDGKSESIKKDNSIF